MSKGQFVAWGIYFTTVVVGCAEEVEPTGQGNASSEAGGGSGAKGGTGAADSGGAGGLASVGGMAGMAEGGSGGVGAAGGLGGEGGQGGMAACDPVTCQTGITSIAEMPVDSTILNFETCTGACSCCSPGGAYQDPIDNTCITCSVDARLALLGITRSGGMGTYFVDCITGNQEAPIEHAALFAGQNVVELEFTQAVTFVGFTALPSSSDSQPTVTFEGYTSEGVLTGIDSFDFLTPGGDCATSNPAARFFGFRACCGSMTRAVVTFSDANTAIDSLSFF